MKLVIVLLAMAAWLSNVGVDSAPMLPAVEKAVLQQFESEIQTRNPNAVWCVWIPQPVRITLPACQGVEKAVLQQIESEIQSNNWWCIWIPQPVRITLPACQGVRAMQSGCYCVMSPYGQKICEPEGCDEGQLNEKAALQQSKNEKASLEQSKLLNALLDLLQEEEVRDQQSRGH